jgi:hypothetical protein
MRRLRELFAISLLCATALGVFGLRAIELPTGNPVTSPNTEEMLVVSENLRQIRAEWRNIWFLDQPFHMTYERVHGGSGP